MKKVDVEQLFSENTKLAYSVLCRVFPEHSKDEDMKQEALLGLWKACLTYDPDKAKFSSYAWFCIRSQIRQALRGKAKQPETVSLSQPVGSEGFTLEDIIEDPCPGIDEGLLCLRTFLEGLSELELKLVQLSEAGLTQREIGKQLGRSRAWCCSTLKRLQKDYLKQEDQDD